MTYEQAVAYLDTFVNYERARDPQAMREVPLSRMRRLCQRLGDPQRRFRSIIVAGTNGKGSISAMLYSMLRESALRVGLYTSPHLEQLRERIRVWEADSATAARCHGDDWISEQEFADLLGRLQPVVDAMRHESPEQAPTFFEIVTAMALSYFASRQVEVAVLEVGLGGRLDATNVADQAVSVIAPIDLDHAEILGADPTAIAKEKAGVIHSAHPVLMAPQRDDVAAVLSTVCEERGAPLYRYHEDFTATIHRHTLDGLELSITGLRGRYESLTVPLLGRHQAENAAVAVGALEALSNTGMPYSLVERGLARVEWPGRLEVVNDAPLVLMDGAHNPHATAALSRTLTELCAGRRIHLLIGMSADKSVESVGALLGGLAISATCVTSRHPRALDPMELAKRLSPFCHDVQVMPDAVDAYTYLLNAVSADDVIVVTGSLFLVGELRAALRRAQGRLRWALQLQAAS